MLYYPRINHRGLLTRMKKEVAHDLKFQGHKEVFRAFVDLLSDKEVTNNLGESFLESTMTMLRWRFGGKTRDMDNEKVDYIYRLNNHSIDIQLKSASFGLRGKSWKWRIFKSNEELDLDFYDQTDTFLALVGLKILSLENGRFYKEVLDSQFPQIALIPGKDIVQYFSKKSVINVSSDKLLKHECPYWNNYFGIDNINKALHKYKLT